MQWNAKFRYQKGATALSLTKRIYLSSLLFSSSFVTRGSWSCFLCTDGIFYELPSLRVSTSIHTSISTGTDPVLRVLCETPQKSQQIFKGKMSLVLRTSKFKHVKFKYLPLHIKSSNECAQHKSRQVMLFHTQIHDLIQY